MIKTWPTVRLEEVIQHRKEFITIDDVAIYKRPRVRSHAQGIVLRDEVPGALIKTKNQQVCHGGEFLVAEIDAKVGGFGIVPEALEGSLVSSHYFLFTIREAKLDRRFLDYYIRTPSFREQVEAQGSTNYAAVRPGHVLGYEIPLPPLAEQRCIVARVKQLISEINQAKELAQESNGATAALFPSLLSEALSGASLSVDVPIAKSAAATLVENAKRYIAPMPKNNNAHPGRPVILDQGPKPLPHSWAWTTLGSVLSVLVDCVNDTPDFAQENTGLLGLKSTNIRPYKLDLSRKWFVTRDDFFHWNRRETPKPNDIILTREAPMGLSCKLPDGINACLTQRLMLLRADSGVVLTDYVLHYLNSSLFLQQVEEQCRGLTTPHIRVQDAPQFLFPLPPLEVQHVLVTKLDELKNEIDRLKTQQGNVIDELDAMIPAVLDRAFKGQL